MNDGRWPAIRDALGSWPKTLQLCVIITVTRVPVPVLLWLVLKH
jgi:hypothetical protein